MAHIRCILDRNVTDCCSRLLRHQPLLLFVSRLYLGTENAQLLNPSCVWYQLSQYLFRYQIVYYLPYAYTIYYWALGLHGFWIQVAVAFALSYVYYYLKIYSMTNYGKDYFPTPRIFELLVEKYLVIERQWGIVKSYDIEE